MFPLGADLVRVIESQISKISLMETFAVARCLGADHNLVGNAFVRDLAISRSNQEFSRGDSWFNVRWYEVEGRGARQKEVNLRYEPGKQICTSYPCAEEETVQTRSEERMEIEETSDNWSGIVGDLFDKAAIMVDSERSPSSERSAEQVSTALWPLKAWKAIETIIWGEQLSKSEFVYRIGIPYSAREMGLT
jgi:hypothetical protein